MTTGMTARVVIVEDYKLVRIGIASVLEDAAGFELAGTYENAEDFLEDFPESRPEMVLMDIGLPGMNGIQAVEKLREISPDTKVVMLTSHDDETEVLASLAAGANAYCLKDVPSDRFIEIIRSVQEGALWLDPRIAQVAFSLFMESASQSANGKGTTVERSESSEAIRANLTPKEQSVLKLMVDGKSNSEIGHELGISVHTVKVHVTHILEKLSVYDRVQAAVKAVKEGIL